jgi:hypothetical protein
MQHKLQDINLINRRWRRKKPNLINHIHLSKNVLGTLVPTNERGGTDRPLVTDAPVGVKENNWPQIQRLREITNLFSRGIYHEDSPVR